MNYIGALQEYFAAKGHSPPSYQTDRIGGTANKPKFQSKCWTGSLTFKGEVCNSKKDAKASAAKQAYEYLIKSVTIKESGSYDSDNSLIVTDDDEDYEDYDDISACEGIIFVDVENVPDFLPNFVKSEYYGKYMLRVCMSLNHPDAEDKMDEKDYYVVDSKAPNAADIGMCMLISSMLTEFEPVDKPIYIVTNDMQFSQALVDIIESQSIADYDGYVRVIGYYQEFTRAVGGPHTVEIESKPKDHIYNIVKQSEEGMSKKDVRRAYRKAHAHIDTKEVNKMLYDLRDQGKLKKTRGNPPVWTVV